MKQMKLIREPGDPAPLEVGDEACCWTSVPCGKEREELTGVARVRVESIADDLYTCVVLLRGGGGRPNEGERITLPRARLYSVRDRVENLRFRDDFYKLRGR